MPPAVQGQIVTNIYEAPPFGKADSTFAFHTIEIFFNRIEEADDDRIVRLSPGSRNMVG